jgi:Mg2+/citrate symporter
MFLWNYVTPTLSINIHHYQLNFLEGAGISAFTYVIVFAIRYGIQERKKVGDHERYAEHSTVRERCSHLTPEQREALKHELITTCGCKEENERVNVEVRSGS